MKTVQQTLLDIKKLRLERHWSQEQLAEFSGVSTRTIQRIENGQAAGYETIKALAAVFEIELVSDAQKEEQFKITKEEEAYIANIKGLYKMIAIALFTLIAPFVLAINNGEWAVFLWMLATWIIIIGINILNTFNLFGDSWKRKMIDKRKK